MIDEFERLHTETAAAVARLRPEGLTVAEADRVLAALTAMAAVVSAGELLVIGRAVEGDTAHAAKERLARRGGISAGEAGSLVQASRALAELPVVAEAVRAGRLSRAQARLVIDTASEVPTAQSALLGAAATEDLKGLRDRCAVIRARSDRDPAATRERQHRSRQVRTWTGKDGCRHGRWCLPPESAAEVEAVLDQWTDVALRHTPAGAEREPIESHRADGLVAMARASVRPRPGRSGPGATSEGAPGRTGQHTARDHGGGLSGAVEAPAPPAAASTVPRSSAGTASSGPGAPLGPPHDVTGSGGAGRDGRLDHLPEPIAKEVVVVVDIITLAAAMAGTSDHLAPDRDGQLCELRGFGPVAPQVAALFMEGDPMLKVVLTEGRDVRIVKHFGRRVPAEFLTGWKLTNPTCADPGCNNCRGLEGDHVIPDALDGPISMATFAPRCKGSHRAKTKVDVAAIAAARAAGFQNMTKEERAAHNKANRQLSFDPHPHAHETFLARERIADLVRERDQGRRRSAPRRADTPAASPLRD